MTAQSLNRLMSLAGESLVQARWLQPFSTALLKLKKQQDHLAGLLGQLGQALRPPPARGAGSRRWSTRPASRSTCAGRFWPSHGRRVRGPRRPAAEDLNSRLYREVIVSRMRPFADGAHGFPRLVRDMARHLGKQVRLDIVGLATEVDRDILEKLEAPLTHLLRNAVDHGIEPPAERAPRRASPSRASSAWRPATAPACSPSPSPTTAAASTSTGCARKVVERRLTTAEMAAEPERGGAARIPLPARLLDRARGHRILRPRRRPGRGADTIRQVGGVGPRQPPGPAGGRRFHLQLPLTLSVLRAVLVDVAGEPYAFPHNRIDRLLRVPRASVRSLEHRQFVARGRPERRPRRRRPAARPRRRAAAAGPTCPSCCSATTRASTA